MPKPGIIPLRPLSVGEILNGAVSYIRAHPKVTLGLAVVVIAITQLVQVPAQFFLLDNLGALGDPANPAPSPEDIGGAVAGSFAGILLSSGIAFVAGTILTGMLIVVVNQSVLGRPITLGETWDAAKSRLPGLIGLSIIIVLIIIAVFLVCAAPAVVAGVAGAPSGATVALGILGGLAAIVLVIYLYVALALAGPAYMLERTDVVAALSRSRRLVGPQWWRIFGILLLTALIAGVLAAIISVPFGFAGGSSGFALGQDPETIGQASLLSLILAAIGTIIAGTITAPFTAGVTGLLYMDQRMRREALAPELAKATATSPPPPGYPQSPPQAYPQNPGYPPPPGYPHPGAPPPSQW